MLKAINQVTYFTAYFIVLHFLSFQPSLVNDQLDQLYLDLELEGLSARLSLGESSSSGSSGEEENSLKMRAKRFKYGSIVMIYEENAPLPPNS